MKRLFLAMITGYIAAASAQTPSGAFVKLTNGRDLSGWDGDKKHWSVEGGAITGVTVKTNTADSPTYLIWRGGTAGDFHLRGKYRFEGDYGNSGVQYRSRESAGYMVTGYQADFEVGPQWSGVLVEMGGRLHLARRGQKVKVGSNGNVEVTGSVGDPDQLQALIRPNEWTDFEIIAQGNHLIHKINGRVMVDVVDGQSEKAARSGIIALQLNRTRPMKVQFRDIDLLRMGR
jgi:hypothetical protein